LAGGVADTTIDRFPIIHDILVHRSILAGGANVTITGDRLNEYPVLGARFVSDDLPELYAYALPALRFTFRFVLSTNIILSSPQLDLPLSDYNVKQNTVLLISAR